MPTSTLFGYSVEDQDGKLVITVHGAYAEEAIRNLTANLASGKGLPLGMLLSPLQPLRQLFSSQVQLPAGITSSVSSTSSAAAPDELLGQGVGKSYALFQEQMATFEQSINALKRDMQAAPSVGSKKTK